ncbi:MAG: hypothetical protein ACSHW1_04550 [Yoonia sp.]|uniref:hypothetical protein n=1 Tax=Yoonia sp. TaxID=2212373 RepID=UPI003EF42FFA
MKNITPFPLQAQSASQDVVTLDCPLQWQFDPEPLVQLFQRKGALVAEEIVCRMLENIALRLDAMQQLLQKAAFEDMKKPIKRISMMARELGLAEVTVTAEHMRVCLEQGDGIAIAAVMARLERGFDVAVSEIWSFREL